MKITNIPTVEASELEKTYDVDIFDCDFAQEAENDSYVRLDLTDDRISDLYEEIEWQEGKGEENSRYCKGLKAELKIIKGLRDIGYEMFMLVHIYW